ncbi:MAG: hypothetical protein NZM27_05940 [Acetobacteraceae bacterium]|nr:hypothetical protein [Acetobacteraceae bacterium]
MALILGGRERFDDTWTCTRHPAVKVRRIWNFTSLLPAMVPDPALKCCPMENFCLEGDGPGTSSNADLVRLGRAAASRIRDGTGIRQPKAYSVYDAEYERLVGVTAAGSPGIAQARTSSAATRCTSIPTMTMRW